MRYRFWFSDATYAIHVQLVAPHYVNYHTDVTLFCNHSVPDNNLLKVEFLKDDSKILEYIRDRNPPFNKVLDKNFEVCEQNKKHFVLSRSESVKFSLIESVICLFIDSSVKKYFSLLNQSIFTEIISEVWLIYSNLFLAIWISQISLIISRFWLIQI